MKVLNFGSMNLDYVYKVDHFVMPGETISASKQQVICGGKGLNQSVALARAGAKVYHGGCCGQGGQMLVDMLRETGVDVSYIKAVDALQGNAIIQVDKTGQNCIILFGGSNQCINEKQIDETLNGFEKGDYIVLQNEINQLSKIIDKAYEKGLKIILNPSPFNEKLEAIDMNKVSWLLVNEVEAAQMAGASYKVTNENAEDIWKIMHGKYQEVSMVMTLGSQGSICFSGNEKIVVSASKVEAVDTTAAGDTFTGYFVAGLMEGLELDECMRRASIAAGISVTRYGAGPSIPVLEEVINT